MDEHDQVLIVIVFSIVGLISLLFLICLFVWLVCRRLTTNRQFDSPNISATRVNIHLRRKTKRRFNTNDSSISLSFNPPHLINQNVKNLDRLLLTNPNDKINRCYSNPKTEPIYTSTSSLSALRSHPRASIPQLNNLRFHFLNELNHALCSKQTNRLKYSQSCRQRNDPLPFDYYRTLTSCTSSSNETLYEPLSPNATLMRKARLAQLRDDTAIYY